jgi:hypothetical protein
MEESLDTLTFVVSGDNTGAVRITSCGILPLVTINLPLDGIRVVH